MRPAGSPTATTYYIRTDNILAYFWKGYLVRLLLVKVIAKGQRDNNAPDDLVHVNYIV